MNTQNLRVLSAQSEDKKQFSEEEGARILQAYTDNISDFMPKVVAEELEAAYNNGMTVFEIMQAIEITGFAPRPSAQYLRAVLRHWAYTGNHLWYNETTGRRIIEPTQAKPWFRKLR